MILQTTGRKPAGCCDEVVFLDLSKMEWPLQFLQLNDYNLWITSFCVVFNPFFWNVVARWEYRYGGISKALGGKKQGVVLMAIMILSLGVFRDWMFKLMLESQPKWPMLYENWLLLSGYASIWIGTTLVFSSFYSLGFYGTFLGDYFGILMDKKVTGFPFNILDNPMYVGSTLNFLGAALVFPLVPSCANLILILIRKTKWWKGSHLGFCQVKIALSEEELNEYLSNFRDVSGRPVRRVYLYP